MTKDGLPYLAEIFKDFENRWNPNYRPVKPDIPFPNKPSAKEPIYSEELERVWNVPSSNRHSLTQFQRMLSRLPVNIKAIGVWDTVGKTRAVPIEVGHLARLTYFKARWEFLELDGLRG